MSTDCRDEAVVPLEAVSGVLLCTRAERDLAVGHWLLSAALDRSEARAQWAEQGVTVLRCGGIFAAVRIPAELVHAAAGTSAPGEVCAYLAEALHGGPVLVDRHGTRYYALVPASTARWWDVPDCECLGVGACLGVPRPGISAPEAASPSYWAVPMDSPGVLCTPDDVSRLVMTGRHQRPITQARGRRSSAVIAEPELPAGVERAHSVRTEDRLLAYRAPLIPGTNQPVLGRRMEIDPELSGCSPHEPLTCHVPDTKEGASPSLLNGVARSLTGSLKRQTRDQIDSSVPNSARIWNYWLGGKDNYRVDREEGDRYAAVFPGIVDVARASRHFIGRSIRYLAGEAGIRQFLDVGTGLPTVDNVHEIAQRVAPGARIVYVDHDPLVLLHARALLTGTPEGTVHYVEADLGDTATIVREAAKALDFDRPIALNLSGIVGHIPRNDEAYAIVGRLVEALPPGSYLALSDAFTEAQDGYNKTGAIPYRLRTPAEITGFFTGLELVEPGVVSCPLWRPEATPFGMPKPVDAFGGVGKKP